MIDLIGKNIQVDNPALIQYFYPQYRYVTNSFIHFSDKPIIYDGEQKYIKQLRERRIQYISLKGVPYEGCNFTVKKDLLAFVFSKHNKEIPKYVLELVDVLSDQEIQQYAKYVWVTGVFPIKEKESFKIYELYKALVDSKSEAIKKLYEMLELSNPNQILSSLLTFVQRVVSPDNAVSANYQRILNSFLTNKRNNIEPALLQLAKDKQNLSNQELILYKFVNNLIK